MSFYVTCVNDKENQIQAILNSKLNPKIKYEVALVETIFSISWKVERGHIQLYKGSSVLFNLDLEGYDYYPISCINQKISEKTDKYNSTSRVPIKTPLFKYDEKEKILKIETKSNVKDLPLKFKLSDKAIETFGIDAKYFTNTTYPYNTPILIKNKILNIYCDIIGEQKIGDKKEQIENYFCGR